MRLIMPEQQLKKFHTLIHLGCGANPNITEYLALAEQIWLIDADAEVIKELEQAVEDLDNIQAKQALVASENEQATFYRYNLSWANGLNPIDEKTADLYPGLVCLSEAESETSAIKSLLRACLSGVETGTKNILLVDLGLENETILRALEEQELIDDFEIIVVIPAHRRSELAAIPLSLTIIKEGVNGFDLPVGSQFLKKHPLWQESNDWRKKAEHWQEKYEQVQLVAEKTQEQLEQSSHVLNERSDELSQVQEVLAKAQEQVTELTQCNQEQNLLVEEYKQQLEQLSQALEKKNKELSQEALKLKELQAQVTELTQKYKKQKKLAEDCEKQLEQRIQELDKRSNILRKKSGLIEEGLDKIKENKYKKIVDTCFEAKDVQEAIDEQLLSYTWSLEEKYWICLLLAEAMLNINNYMQATHWLNQAHLFLSTGVIANISHKYFLLFKLAERSNQLELAIDFLIQAGAYSENINEIQRDKLFLAYEKMRISSKKSKQHGHDLLLDYIAQLPECFSSENGQQRTLVEIGTTRENVPGQGSTLQLAALAQKKGIAFISVDMDKRNSYWAQYNLELMKLPGKMITAKGEVYLEEMQGVIDYVFLDAYDFDHGNHSELRQLRYQKYLGSRIDEQLSHKMHLSCVKSILTKLSDNGVVCIDDTWQDNEGNWTAKGTLAIPFLLDNGFEIIEVRNRAVLMKKKETIKGNKQ